MDLKSNEPFWLIKNGLLSSYPSLRQDIECEILIIGGGITGSLIAHQCVGEGYDTVLLDKREVCNGSSSATTSMLQYEIDTPLYRLIEMIGEKGAKASYKACFDAIDQIGIMTKEIGSGAGFRKKKSLYFAAWKKDVTSLKKEYETRKKAGYAVKWMESGEILHQYGIHHAHGGILSEQGASVDAFKLAHELHQYNSQRGLRIYDKTELLKVEYKKGYNLCHTSDGVNIKAKKVIYCVGYEAANIIPEQFVKLLSSYAIVSEIDNGIFRKYKDLLIWNTAEPYLYMRTTDDHRFLIGGEDEEFQNPQKRDALICKKSKKLHADFQKIFPDLTFYPDFAWAGTFGETKDGLPYIGEHPDFKNSYFVLGFGGNGITFSVAGMEMVSNWLKGKKHHLSPWFRFGR